MSEHDAHRPGLGSMPHDGGTAFRVWAPNADAVAVTGSFTDWSGDGHAMVAEDNGHWYADVEGVGPGDEYQFVITNGDQRLMRIDPRARRRHELVGQRHRLRPRRLRLGGRHVRLPAARRARHLRDPHRLVRREPRATPATSRGSPASSTTSPSSASTPSSSCRSPSSRATTRGATTRRNPFAVESGYGGADALKAFVREAHRHGIAVILDVVLNHFGPSDLALWQFDGWSENGKGGIYFYNDERSATPWGDTRPDYGREEVRAYLHDNALMWLEEYHLDGLRFDATLYIRTIDGLGTGDLPEGWDAHALDHRERPRAPPRQDPHRRGPAERRPAHHDVGDGRRRLPRAVGRRLRRTRCARR